MRGLDARAGWREIWRGGVERQQGGEGGEGGERGRWCAVRGACVACLDCVVLRRREEKRRGEKRREENIE